MRITREVEEIGYAPFTKWYVTFTNYVGNAPMINCNNNTLSGEGISISVTEIKKGSAVAVTTGTVIVDAKDLTSVSPLQLVVSDPDNFVALSVFDQELMSALELTRPLGVSVVRSTYGYGEVGYAGYKFTFTTLP